MSIVYTWDADALETARASGAVWSSARVDVGAFEAEPRVARLELLHGETEIMPPLPNMRIPIELSLKIAAASLTGTSPTGESRLIDAWAEAASFFNPVSSAVKLACSRPDSDGNTVSRYLLASALSVSQFQMRMNDPQERKESGAYDPDGGCYIVWVQRADTRFPWWTSAALLDQDTAPATAELAVGASTDTVTIVNPGDRWAGVRLEVKAASVSGTVTGWSVSNGANASVLGMTKATAMAAAEAVDWYATSPLANSRSSGWEFSTAAPNTFRLEPGSNTLTVTRTAGSGTLTLLVSWPSHHLTI